MADAPPFVLDLLAAAPALELALEDGAGTLAFEAARYEPAADRLRLVAGPPAAASVEMTPEGDLVHVAAPDGNVRELVLRDVRRRLARDGAVEITLAPGRRARLAPGDIAHLLTSGRRTGRFRRAA